MVLVERLDIGINAEWFAVHAYERKVAVRRRQSRCAKKLVADELMDSRAVLIVVVQRERVHAGEHLLLFVLIDLNLERRAVVVERADEPFLANGHLADVGAVDCQVRGHIVERFLLLRWRDVGAQGLDHRPVLRSQLVPVPGIDLQVDFDQA